MKHTAIEQPSKWYAVRTMPGAQMPQREYAVEETGGKLKGYRIVPSLNPNVSAVERALTRAGFVHYMPVERKIIRDRKKTNVWTTRRFALLQGYVFVHDVRDWRKLEKTPGVANIVKIEGVPIAVDLMDILALRGIEAEMHAEVESEIERREAMAKRVTRKKAKGLFPSRSRVEITSGHMSGRRGTVVSTDRAGKIKMIIDKLDALGSISVGMDVVKLIGQEDEEIDIVAA